MSDKGEQGIGKRDIEFLYEIGCLRFIPRAWRQIHLPNVANLAEHTLRVVWIAALIAEYEKANVSKVIKLALVHDVPESRTGDVHYISRLYTKRDEQAAINEIFKEVILGDDFLDLWKEYEERESLESKIVKDADNLDVDFEIQEQASRGVNLKNDWEEDRKKFVYSNFYTATAKAIFEIIYSSDPNGWYQNAKNRFSEGDYGK